MAELELNVAHRNAILNATGAIFNGGQCRVYTGARPGANEAATGTLLASVSIPTPAFGAAASGSMSKAGVWTGEVVATGAPGYYRTVNDGAAQVREGDADETPGAGEGMILSDLQSGDLVQGGILTITTYVMNQDAGDAVV